MDIIQMARSLSVVCGCLTLLGALSGCPDERSCSTSDDCRETEVCVAKTCRLRCTSDDNCTRLEHCENGACFANLSKPDATSNPDASGSDGGGLDATVGDRGHGNDTQLPDLSPFDISVDTRVCSPGERRCSLAGDVEQCNLAGDAWNLFDACHPSAETCQSAQCICIPQQYQACHAGDVFWFDGCDNPEGLVEDCALECDNGQCVAELNCTPEEKRCTADGDVEQCNHAGDGWQLFEECNAQTHDCAGGVCACIEHHHLGCHSGDVYWFDACDVREELEQDCGAELCDNGGCVPVLLCTPGEQRCAANGDVEECTPDGDGWTLYDTCNPDTEYCSGAQCRCQPHHHRGCVGNQAYWYDGCDVLEDLIMDCADSSLICDQGECVTGINCTPGELRCNGAVEVEVCNAEGDGWLLDQTCDGTTRTCIGGSCTCIPHHHPGCQDDDLSWFDGCGQVEELIESCAYGCDDATCRLCTPGVTRCSSGGDVEVCNPEGSAWQTTVDCPDGREQCTGDPPHCECIPELYQACLGDQLRWFNGCDNPGEVIETCTYGCVVDRCLTCPPDEPRCSPQGNVELCDPLGTQWLLELECAHGCNPADWSCICEGDEVQCDRQCSVCPTVGAGHVLETSCLGQRCFATACEAGFLPCGTGCCTPSRQTIGTAYVTTTSELELTSQAEPAFAYHDYGANRIRYVIRRGGWQIEDVKYVTATNLECVDLAFTPDDEPVIAWTYNSKLYLAVHDEETGWIDMELDRALNTSCLDLEIDSAGDLHVVYRDDLHDLVHLYGTPLDYTIELVDDYPAGSAHPALALDPYDQPHIAYATGQPPEGFYLAYQDAEGWSKERVLEDVSPNSVDLEVDRDGLFHIAFTFSIPQPPTNYLRYASGDLTVTPWVLLPVAEGEGSVISLDLIDKRLPRIACIEPTEYFLTVSYPAGGTWPRLAMGLGGDRPGMLLLATDNDGFHHIVYNTLEDRYTLRHMD